jgi:hypothetical protein
MAMDGGSDAPSTRPGQISAAFAAARALREDAQAEADEIRRSAAAASEMARNDAERAAARRMQEAELLVAKARRTMAIADEKAAVIVSNALAEADRIVAEARVLVQRSVQPEAVVLDLTDTAIAEAAAVANAIEAEVASDNDPYDLAPRREPNDLDRMLGSAIHKAVAKLAKTWEQHPRFAS